MNLGTLSFLLSLYILKVVALLLILKPLTMIFTSYKNFYNNTFKQMFFSELIFLFVEGYMEFLISGSLAIFAPEISIDKTNYAVSTAYTCLAVAVIIIPGLYIWVLLKPIDKLQEEDFKIRWGSLFMDINPRKKVNYLYPFVFVLRRLLFVVIAFQLRWFSALQIMALNYVNMFSIIYIGNFLPLENRIRNRMEFINEIIIAIINLHLFCFTEFLDS